MSDETDDDVPLGPTNSRKAFKKKRSISDSSSSDRSLSPILTTRRKKNLRIVSEDSDSDNSGCSIVMRKKKKVALISSDSDEQSDSSDSIIIRRVKRPANIIESEDEDQGFKGSSSQWETDTSDNEEKTNLDIPQTSSKKENNFDSDSSDGESEKCPICLLPIKKQELGSPEICDHLFCVECILEWSKNMNTCPVDRKEYRMILVRKKINGKVVRKIPIEKPSPVQVSQEDQTFCEICGMGDREDRLLLCDGCDLGFHLECLTPALQEVPLGSWFCNECDPSDIVERELNYMELHLLLEDQEMSVTPRNFGRSRTANFRLIPRTRQNERVRSQIMRNRSNTYSIGFEEPSSSTNTLQTSNVRQYKKRKTTKRRKTKKKYRMVYEIDEKTGDVISKKKQVKSRRRKKKRVSKNSASAPAPKTAQGRLAQQLGVCSTKVTGQCIPEMKNPHNRISINAQRYQAAVPTVDLFGHREELEYFSQSDDDLGGPNYLVRRRPNQNDVNIFRRAARRKAILFSSPTTVSSSSDLLGSILESQTQLYSKSINISVDSSFKKENDNSNNNLNVKDFNKLAKQTPYNSNNSRNNDRRVRQQPYSNNSSYQGNSSYYNVDNLAPSSTSENYSSFSNREARSNYDQEMPQDYTRSTLSNYPRDNDVERPSRNEDEEPTEDSDIDIYSDIEDSVSTSKVEEDNTQRPINSLPCDNVGRSNGSDIDNENNDSENEMVIDTEKAETSSHDLLKEDTCVTSSEDTVVKCNSSSDAIPHSTSDIQSTFEKCQEDIEDEDADSEDGCPNFSIYSTESINLAKNTDISLNPDDESMKSDQVEVDSSTPISALKTSEVSSNYEAEEVYNPEIPYDPEIEFNSDKESEIPEPDSEVENAYDPERVYDTPESQDTYDLEKTFNDDDDDSEQKSENSKNKVNDKGENVAETENIPLPVDPLPESSDNLKKNEELSTTNSEEPNRKTVNLNVLYSDSEDEEVVKINSNSFIVGDMSMMTEDVSEEERSYTPCLDERIIEKGNGVDGLDTEMISDDEKNNDFDESQEQKAASEGDALEINAKEFEMDLIRPEDYEEGEIVDKNKANNDSQKELPKDTTKDKKKTSDIEKENSKENNENKNKEPATKGQPFKKLSKNTKERNYRDKDRSKSREKNDKEKNKGNTKEKRKDKRKEIERYNVRAIVAVKPKRTKDKFGRDVRKSSSQSKSRSRSRSYTPKRSPIERNSRKRISPPRDNKKNKKEELTRSRSRSRPRKRSHSRRRRSSSPSKRKRKFSKDRSKRRKRDESPNKSFSQNRKHRRNWEEERYSRSRERDRFSNERRWTPSLSRSPEIEPRHASPSWTPPRAMESAAVDPRNLTIILQNDQNKKRKEKKRKIKKKETDRKNKRKKKEQTPPPSKEIFASGDNILVSVSFNKENENGERDVFTKKKKEIDDHEKKKKSLRRKKKNQELSGIKPVAIIDLERSPFKELTPSPKDIIVLSDEEQAENNSINDPQNICDSSQQVASPENVYMTGPKTPPEPQVKFLLPSKQTLLRPLISNPIHDPEDDEDDIPNEQETQNRENRDSSDLHKGPNTPPDPPNSPLSSPDAYDPFEPTKSRSPSPDNVETIVTEDNEKRNTSNDSIEKNTTIPPSSTPPISDVQPADSQSSLQISRDSSKSPDQNNRIVQTPAIQTIPFTSGSVTVTTPATSNSGPSRITILNSTILSNVSSTIPQRIVAPNIKLSPIKISPAKNVPKPTPNKNNPSIIPSKSKSKNLSQNDSNEGVNLDLDSPYSPGSSDYEDLFEPPPEVVTKKTLNKSVPPPNKDITLNKTKSIFDALFESPNKAKKISGDKSKSKKLKGTKIVGVKLDEDHLKILDDLPNSAVEMQVKDKFLKKLNRQERVVEEVKLVLKPYYNKKKIDKEEYKDIMRRAVPKICHNKSGEINPTRIKNLIEAYVKKMRRSKPKVTSSSSYNPLG